MEFLFTPKFKLLLIIFTSILGFAYFKYIKKSEMGWKIGIIFGCIMLTIGTISASIAFSPEKIANVFFLLEDAPWGVERMILIGHIFVLTGLMSLIDTILSKSFKIQRER